ncbi:MAG: VWA domain-containing protein [Thiolinea sp.]
MKKISIQKLLIATLTAFLTHTAATAEEKGATPETPSRQSTMIILDGSNSMWGQLQGINKIVTARESLKTLLENAHGSIDFGLLTYGDKSKRGCTDFTLVSKPEDYNQQEMLNNINRMNPRGRSPIADALKKAAENLPTENAHILLVSDGEESCGGDPCAVAGDLRRTNPNLQIDVIGFRDEKEAQLECIAENGNGAFVVADNTERLKTLLAGVQAKARSVMKTAGTGTTGTATNAQANDPDLPGSVEMAINSDLTDNQAPPRANFSIYTPDGSNVASFTSRTQVKEYLKPGTYRVTAQWQGKSYTDNVTIQSGKTSQLKFNTGASGILKLSALDADNQPVRVNYSIYRTNGDFISRHVYQNSVEVRIPSTEYRIKADFDGKIQEKTLLIESGADNSYVFHFK